jgi:hypothetical protein
LALPDEHQHEDRVMSFRLALAAAFALLTAAQASEPPADIAGHFTLRYQPITCVRAPCPPGMITIETRAGTPRTLSVQRIEPDPRTAPDLAARLKSFPARAYVLVVDGELQILQGTGGVTAVIYARSLEVPPAPP